MPDVERTVTVSKPLPAVWDYLHDFSNAVDWDPPTVSCDRVSGDGGKGTVYRNVSKFLGQETEVTYEVTEFVEYQRFQLKGDAGKSLDLLDTITFAETEDGGTAVTYHAEFQPSGGAKLAEPLMPAGLELLANRVASSLEETLTNL